MSYTAPRTWVTGEFVTAAFMNSNVRDDVKFLHGKPTCRLRRTSAQSFASGSYIAVQWQTADWDTDTMWSSTLNERIKVRTAGKYLVTFITSCAGSTGGVDRSGVIHINSTAYAAGDQAQLHGMPFDIDVAFGAYLPVTQVFSLTTSDYICCSQYQDSGGALNNDTNLAEQPKVAVLWLSS